MLETGLGPFNRLSVQQANCAAGGVAMVLWQKMGKVDKHKSVSCQNKHWPGSALSGESKAFIFGLRSQESHGTRESQVASTNMCKDFCIRSYWAGKSLIKAQFGSARHLVNSGYFSFFYVSAATSVGQGAV